MAALASSWSPNSAIPLLDGAVGGDDGGAVLVALADDLVEILGLLVAQGPQPQVVNDEQLGAGEALQAADRSCWSARAARNSVKSLLAVR